MFAFKMSELLFDEKKFYESMFRLIEPKTLPNNVNTSFRAIRCKKCRTKVWAHLETLRLLKYLDGLHVIMWYVWICFPCENLYDINVIMICWNEVFLRSRINVTFIRFEWIYELHVEMIINACFHVIWLNIWTACGWWF